MYPRYFARRRLNPYRGVTQVVEVEDAEARSFDGRTWHLRADDGYGWVRPIGVWVAGEGLKAGRIGDHQALPAALEAMPPLPFPLRDTVELWLLDKADGLPLALLDARLPSAGVDDPGEPDWQPFLLTYTAFRSDSLGSREAHHREWLRARIMAAARPLAASQWFRRDATGAGEGLGGHRLEAGWPGRQLPAEAFPELLVRVDRNNLLEKSVINDYHRWLAAFLLPWPHLSDATRQCLEIAARERPRWLTQVYRLLPRVLDPAALNAALVAARLEMAEGEGEAPF